MGAPCAPSPALAPVTTGSILLGLPSVHRRSWTHRATGGALDRSLSRTCAEWVLWGLECRGRRLGRSVCPHSAPPVSGGGGGARTSGQCPLQGALLTLQARGHLQQAFPWSASWTRVQAPLGTAWSKLGGQNSVTLEASSGHQGAPSCRCHRLQGPSPREGRVGARGRIRVLGAGGAPVGCRACGNG